MTDKRLHALDEEFPVLAEIADDELRSAVTRVLLRMWEESGLEALRDAPWFTVTRAERQTPTSLVEHIRQVAATALSLAETSRKQGGSPDRDQLVAGALLQDADKFVMVDHATGEPTDAARYSQHTFYGAHVALDEGVPWPVVHMVLSHSKNTGVRPATLEAVILHYADYAVFDMRNSLEGRDRLAAEEKPKWARS